MAGVGPHCTVEPPSVGKGPIVNSTAPACPEWCDSHADPNDGWDSNGRDVTKFCTHETEAARTIDHEAVTVTIARYATLDDGELAVENDSFEVFCPGRLSRAEVLKLAETILHTLSTSLPVEIRQWVA